ncbi:MAG TPA: hypothetical protein VFP43_06530, partial [Mesorhizobium sp.]|nr:hypothetical protein [Mesorhizobium sp.]
MAVFARLRYNVSSDERSKERSVARIFISHASVDGEPAQRMKTWLDGIGFDKSFLDFDDQAGIAPGDDWERRLYSELERSQA